MISIFSRPPSSSVTVCTRIPFCPTQAPTGSTPPWLLKTAILALSPGSLATFFIWTVPKYFRYLSFEKYFDKFWVTPRDNNASISKFILNDLLEIDNKCIVDLVTLISYLFFFGKKSLGSTYINIGVSSVVSNNPSL